MTTLNDHAPVLLNADGNIELEAPAGGLEGMNNGERRIICRELGCSFQAIARALDEAGDEMLNLEGFDFADLNYAFGRIALRRKYGVDADVPANADRVLLLGMDGETADPTEAS